MGSIEGNMSFFERVTKLKWHEFVAKNALEVPSLLLCSMDSSRSLNVVDDHVEIKYLRRCNHFFHFFALMLSVLRNLSDQMYYTDISMRITAVVDGLIMSISIFESLHILAEGFFAFTVTKFKHRKLKLPIFVSFILVGVSLIFITSFFTLRSSHFNIIQLIVNIICDIGLGSITIAGVFLSTCSGYYRKRVTVHFRVEQKTEHLQRKVASAFELFPMLAKFVKVMARLKSLILIALFVTIPFHFIFQRFVLLALTLSISGCYGYLNVTWPKFIAFIRRQVHSVFRSARVDFTYASNNNLTSATVNTISQSMRSGITPTVEDEPEIPRMEERRPPKKSCCLCCYRSKNQSSIVVRSTSEST